MSRGVSTSDRGRRVLESRSIMVGGVREGEVDLGWRCKDTTASAHLVSTFHQDGDEDVPCSSPVLN